MRVIDNLPLFSSFFSFSLVSLVDVIKRDKHAEIVCENGIRNKSRFKRNANINWLVNIRSKAPHRLWRNFNATHSWTLLGQRMNFERFLRHFVLIILLQFFCAFIKTSKKSFLIFFNLDE